MTVPTNHDWRPVSDEPFPDDPRQLDGLERLVAIERFAASLSEVPWFAHLGQPLLESEMVLARDYLDALGAGDAALATVGDWADAGTVAENPGFDTGWWDAEEQLRVALAADALIEIHEDELTLALTRLGERAALAAGEAAAAAAALARFTAEDLVRAATGAAVQAAHQRALVFAADATADHPFVRKFALFESGRWPIGVIGESFHVF